MFLPCEAFTFHNISNKSAKIPFTFLLPSAILLFSFCPPRYSRRGSTLSAFSSSDAFFCSLSPVELVCFGVNGATSRLAHLEKLSLTFSWSSISIRVNLSILNHPCSFVIYYFSLRCFSLQVNNYFHVSFDYRCSKGCLSNKRKKRDVTRANREREESTTKVILTRGPLLIREKEG